MPSPRHVYQSIAQGLRPTISYAEVEGRPGAPQRTETRPSWMGVQQLDRVIQQALKDNPGWSYERAVQSVSIDGRALSGSLLDAARQLGEARRQRLLRPGDEDH